MIASHVAATGRRTGADVGRPDRTGEPAGNLSAVPAEIVVRELTHADRAAVDFTLRHLGQRSRYQRYLGPGDKTTRHELDRLLAVDHWHHEVLIACHLHPRIPVGVAEYVRDPYNFDRAELALVVADEWQRHGVGTLLVDALRERALAAGVRTITATVLSENTGAIRLMKRLGPLTRQYDGATAELAADLGAPH